MCERTEVCLSANHVTYPGLAFSPRLGKCQLSQQFCCSEIVQASVLQLKTFVFLSPRLKVENGRESVPQAKWQARIMTEEQFTMRTFFHCKTLIGQAPNFSLEMALQSIGRNVWSKWARKKIYVPSHHCLSEQGFKDVICFLHEEKRFVQIQNLRYLGIWFASEKCKFLTFTSILTSLFWMLEAKWILV